MHFGGGTMKLIIVSGGWLLAMVSIAMADSQYDEMSAFAAAAQAHWAQLSFWTTCISLLVSIAALIGLFTSLRQTRLALEQARDLGHAQGRAYVEASDVQFSEDLGCILVSCKNSGQTPSPYIAIGLEAVFTDTMNMDHVLVARTEIAPEKSWHALGAAGGFTAKLTPRTGYSSVQDWLRGVQMKDARLLIYGTIIYSDVFKQYFKTEFAFFTHAGAGRSFLRPHRDLPAYKPLTSDEYNRWLGMDV